MNFDFTKEPGKILEQRYDNIINRKPLVTIITAFYNAGKYIEQTYNSILNQTFPWFEWIIVNDGSTNQEDIVLLDRLAFTDNRIRILHKENGGISTARNLGIKHAQADIIVFIDADDLMEPTYLEVLYWSLITHPEASWSYCGLVAFSGDNYLWDQEFTSEREKTENVLIVSSAIRKSALEDVGYYSEIYKHFNEDWHLWLRLLTKGHIPLHLEHQFLFWYRINQTGVASIVIRDQDIAAKNKELIESTAKNVPDGIRAITFKNRRPKDFVRPRKWDWNWRLPFLKSKIRVLLLLPHMEMGGADKFNLDLVRCIDYEKFEIGIITTNWSYNEWQQEFGVYCKDIFNLPAFLDMNDWSAFIHYYIVSRQVDIVFNISSFYGYYLFPWLRKEFPDIGLIDYVHADACYWRNGGYARLSSILQDISEKTFVANKVTKEIMVNKYNMSEEKCIVSYIGTDPEYFAPDKIPFGTIRDKFNISIDQPVVLYLCRLSPEKRPLLMIEIAKELQQLIENVVFLVVGDGSELECIKKKVIEYKLENTVIFAGSQKDVSCYYRDSNVLLITSIKEGLTLTTFEAMSMELPVISADVGGQSEVVSEKTGALIKCLQDEEKEFNNCDYNYEEIDDYVKALYEYLINNEKRINTGKYCRQLIQNNFSFTKAIKDIENELIKIKNGSGLEKRHDLSKMLNSIPNLVDEFITLYCSYEAKQLEATEIWGGRNWYKMLYEKSIQKNVPDENSLLAQKQFEEIYSMRSWRLIEKYRKFMDCTFLGKWLSKIRDLILGKRRHVCKQ